MVKGVVQEKGDDAALYIIESGDTLDLPFIDTAMRGVLRAQELARKMKHTMSEAAILFISDFTDNDPLFNGQLDSDSYFVAKPLAWEELRQKLDHILHQAVRKPRMGR